MLIKKFLHPHCSRFLSMSKHLTQSSYSQSSTSSTGANKTTWLHPLTNRVTKYQLIISFNVASRLHQPRTSVRVSNSCTRKVQVINTLLDDICGNWLRPVHHHVFNSRHINRKRNLPEYICCQTRYLILNTFGYSSFGVQQYSFVVQYFI